MALLVMEGWETRAQKPGWVQPGASFPAGRFGGFSMTPLSIDIILSFPSPLTTPIIGTAILPNLTGSARNVWVLGSVAGDQLTLRTETNGSLTLLRGGTTIATSAVGTLSHSVWAYIEVKATLADTGGTCEIRVNGATAISFTGDTRNTGTDTAFVRVSLLANSGTTYDDLYVADTTGSAPYNDFLGEVKIETLTPNGNGAFSQLLGSDGNSTDNYLLVDELPASMADYVGSATSGQRDTYAFSNPTTLSGQVLAVQASAYVMKTDAGPKSVKLVERVSSGPTERVSSAQTVSDVQWKTTGPRVTDPTGSTWSIATVQSAEFGAEVG